MAENSDLPYIEQRCASNVNVDDKYEEETSYGVNSPSRAEHSEGDGGEQNQTPLPDNEWGSKSEKDEDAKSSSFIIVENKSEQESCCAATFVALKLPQFVTGVVRMCIGAVCILLQIGITVMATRNWSEAEYAGFYSGFWCGAVFIATGTFGMFTSRKTKNPGWIDIVSFSMSAMDAVIFCIFLIGMSSASLVVVHDARHNSDTSALIGLAATMIVLSVGEAMCDIIAITFVCLPDMIPN